MTSHLTETQRIMDDICEKLPAGSWLWSYLGINPRLISHFIFGSKSTWLDSSNLEKLPIFSSHQSFQAQALWYKAHQWQMLGELESALQSNLSDSEFQKNLMDFSAKTQQNFSLQLRQVEQVCLAQLQGMSDALALKVESDLEDLILLLKQFFSRLDAIAKTALEKYCEALISLDSENGLGIEETWTNANETPFGILFTDTRLWKLLSTFSQNLQTYTKGKLCDEQVEDAWLRLQAQWFNTVSRSNNGDEVS